MAGDVYRFGGWTVEPHLNRISQGGTEVHLEPLAMDILVYLLDRPGQTISVDTLLDAAWPGRVVELNTVYQTINQIRRALGDDARSPRFIETVRKRGYRAIAPAERLNCQQPNLEFAPPANGAAAGSGLGPVKGVAVMPFDDLSPRSDHVWLAEGITEELIEFLG